MSSWSEGNRSRGAQQAERMRQQLEELDGLLRQLLALPTADGPDASAGTKSLEEVDPPSEESPVLRLPVSEASGPVGEGPTEPFREAPDEAEAGIDEAPSKALAASPQPAQEFGPAIIRFEPHPREASSTDIESHPTQAERGIAHRNQEATLARDSEGVSEVEPRHDENQERAYWLLTPINRGYERALASLGPLGKPLATPAGRNLLGWLGLIMLLGAAALCLGGWLGWTW